MENNIGVDGDGFPRKVGQMDGLDDWLENLQQRLDSHNTTQSRQGEAVTMNQHACGSGGCFIAPFRTSHAPELAPLLQ